MELFFYKVFGRASVRAAGEVGAGALSKEPEESGEAGAEALPTVRISPVRISPEGGYGYLD